MTFTRYCKKLRDNLKYMGRCTYAVCKYYTISLRALHSSGFCNSQGYAISSRSPDRYKENPTFSPRLGS